MYACSVEPPFCTVLPNGLSDCGSYWVARVYFYSFFVVSAYVIMNLVAAVLVDTYHAIFAPVAIRTVTAADLERFVFVSLSVACYRVLNFSCWCV